LQQVEAEMEEAEMVQQMHDIMRLAGLVEGADYQVGISKVFMRDGRVQTLQTRLASVVERSALRIQGNMRVWLARRLVASRKHALACLKASLRRTIARHLYMQANSGKYATFLQAAARRAVVRRRFCLLSKATQRIQFALRAKNLARLPHLLAKLEQTRFEVVALRGQNLQLTAQLEEESAKVRSALLETNQKESDMAIRIQEVECLLHAKGREKEHVEELVTQAEEALVRVRRAKDASESGREELLNQVATLKEQVEVLNSRNEELSAENKRCHSEIRELNKQRARLTKICGLRQTHTPKAGTPALRKSVSPSTRSPQSTRTTPPLSSRSSSQPKASPALTGGVVCETSFTPLLTQDVLKEFGSITPTALVKPSPLASPSPSPSPVARQGCIITVSGTNAAKKPPSSCSPSATLRSSPAFGRHSAERVQKRKSSLAEPKITGSTPWKQERRMTEIARRSQEIRSSIARAETGGGKGKPKRNDKEANPRRSLDESKPKRRFNREQFILEQVYVYIPHGVGVDE